MLLPAFVNVKYGDADENGRMAIDPIFDEGNSFQDDRALVRVEQRFGYISPDGIMPSTLSSRMLARSQKGVPRLLTKAAGVSLIPRATSSPNSPTATITPSPRDCSASTWVAATSR